MMRKADVKELIDDLFEEEALVIAGLAAVHEVDDELVRRLMSNLHVIRGRALRRLAVEPAGGSVAASQPDSLSPHPAIDEFLRSLRRSPGVPRGHIRAPVLGSAW